MLSGRDLVVHGLRLDAECHECIGHLAPESGGHHIRGLVEVACTVLRAGRHELPPLSRFEEKELDFRSGVVDKPHGFRFTEHPGKHCTRVPEKRLSVRGVDIADQPGGNVAAGQPWENGKG